jgi:hypothetical protein
MRRITKGAGNRALPLSLTEDAIPGKGLCCISANADGAPRNAPLNLSSAILCGQGGRVVKAFDSKNFGIVEIDDISNRVPCAGSNPVLVVLFSPQLEKPKALVGLGLQVLIDCLAWRCL